MNRKHWLTPTVLVPFAIAIGASVIHFGGPRVVIHAVSPGGVEMCIIQRFSWGPDLFTTSFWYHKPGQPWGWFYYDHEDWLWTRAKASVDMEQTTAVFYRDGKPAVTFDWAAEQYTLHRINRTLTGAQSWAAIRAPAPL